jgi:hypothetical protein
MITHCNTIKIVAKLLKFYFLSFYSWLCHLTKTILKLKSKVRALDSIFFDIYWQGQICKYLIVYVSTWMAARCCVDNNSFSTCIFVNGGSCQQYHSTFELWKVVRLSCGFHKKLIGCDSLRRNTIKTCGDNFFYLIQM